MHAPETLTQVVCAVALSLYALGGSRGDPAPMAQGPEKNYEEAIARAELLYQAAQDLCEKAENNKRELCFKEAKATHVRAVADAKARLKAAQMVSYRRMDTLGVRPESQW